jgi:type II secretory pathway predicted ATPase ExeA
MMPLDKRLARFGLNVNPFAAATPPTACHLTDAMRHFCDRCHRLVGQGGFALVSGESGTGKSALLRCLHAQLTSREELVLGVLSRPQASLADFYRELGALFGVSLTPHNRWAGAKVLRERWQTHWGTSHQRPVLFLDEAQEMHGKVLNELRLLATAELDSAALVTVILAGDQRLHEKFQARDLLPLASRIRVQHRTEAASNDDLRRLLDHLLTTSGNRDLMTEGLKHTCVEHACGNRRVLLHLADELLDAALADPDCQLLDEHLFTRVVRPPQLPAAARPRKTP